MGPFAQRVEDVDSGAMRAARIDTLLVNVGLRCNMSCSHCHQSCSPDRTEAMSPGDIETVAAIAAEVTPQLVDITGGAPELHPGSRRLVDLLAESRLPTRIRTNLTALLEPGSEGLIEFLAEREVQVLASLPGTSSSEPSVRPVGTFDRSIQALDRLRDAGYGRSPRLRLDIAVNPAGASLPNTCGIEGRVRTALVGRHDISFDTLVSITNVPVGRMSRSLRESGEYDSYHLRLRDAFNPATVDALSCRYSLAIGWDGTLSDCDFNLGAGLSVAQGVPSHISEFDIEVLRTRPIRFAEHCFACTADAGSG